MWIIEILNATINVIERWTCFLMKARTSWNIFLTSFSNHLYGEIRFKKMGLTNMLTKEENVILIKWTLTRMETIHKPIVTKQGYKVDRHKRYTILKWNTMQ
jgi:hypothetical protein